MSDTISDEPNLDYYLDCVRILGTHLVRSGQSVDGAREHVRAFLEQEAEPNPDELLGGTATLFALASPEQRETRSWLEARPEARTTLEMACNFPGTDALTVATARVASFLSANARAEARHLALVSLTFAVHPDEPKALAEDSDIAPKLVSYLATIMSLDSIRFLGRLTMETLTYPEYMKVASDSQRFYFAKAIRIWTFIEGWLLSVQDEKKTFEDDDDPRA